MTATKTTSPTAGAPTRSSTHTARRPAQARAHRERRDDGRDRRGNRDERRGRGERQRPSPANDPGSPTKDPPDMRDAHLPSLLSLPGNAQATVLRMRELFGPMLPDDTVFEDATVADSALAGMAFTCNYDEGYCGHFTIPGGDGAAANVGKVAEAGELLPFVREHLETRPAGWQEGPAAREMVVFAPGLNTLHKVKAGWEGEQTTPFRLEHYVRVLQRPMAQLHLGTDMDQGEVEITSSPALIAFIEANRASLEMSNVMPVIEGGRAVLEPRKRDQIELLLSSMGFARPLLQESVVELLRRNEVERQPLVLMPYSRGSGEVSGALRQYKAAAIMAYLEAHGIEKAAEAAAAVEAQMRETLTVVSVGNIDRNWPDGPAYVHLAAVSDRKEGGTDMLVRDRGVTAAHPDGAGADAVFVHTDGVFSSFDVHNFGAVGAPTLRLVLAMNGISTFRKLWKKGREGALRLPTYAEVAAAIVLVDGKDWLWRAADAYNGVTLPSRDEAEALLAEWW